MESGRAARAAETAKTHETMIEEPNDILIEITATAAPELIARVRASLRAAKLKTFGCSPRG